MRIDDLPDRCFYGFVPSMIATSDRDGMPNVSYLSEIERLPGDRIALSCQFFNKTKRNVLENPRVVLEVYDPVSFEAYRIEARFSHEEAEGPLFDRMAARIAAIGSQAGMAGVFALRTADIYDVRSVERRVGFLESAPEAAHDGGLPDTRPRSELRALQTISQRLRSASDLDSLLAALFESLEEELGFEHAMVLFPDEEGKKLFVVGTHGYQEGEVGAEVPIGHGLVGTVARDREVVRMGVVEAELRYQRAIRGKVERMGGRGTLSPELPLPGLPDAESQLALPLVVGDRLIGVFAVESRERMAFDAWHETFLEVVSNQVASAIDSVLLRAREEEEADGTGASAQGAVGTEHAPVRKLRYFVRDECLFVDDEYLIRNVPARILWYVLATHAKTGRTEFTNRELRVQSAIGLPGQRDNLESRLVLLRRRLAEKCPDLAIPSIGRGRFQLVLRTAVELGEEP